MMRLMLATLLVVSLLCAVAAGAEPTWKRHVAPWDTATQNQRRNFEEAYRRAWKQGGAGRSIARDLLQHVGDDDLDVRLWGLARACHQARAHDAAGELVDELLRSREPASDVLAADVLRWLAQSTDWSNYGLSRAVENYPDALCQRAAKLLDHRNPVVRALADWALSQRVRLQDGGTRSLDEMFWFTNDRRPWFQSWKRWSLDASQHLAHDYARQLAHLNLHGTPGRVGLAGRQVRQRLERMLADVESRSASSEKATFDQAFVRLQRAAEGGKLLEAQQAYVELRLAGRDVVRAARSEFPAEGVVYYTNPRIPGGVWNVNVAVTGRTNPPVGDIYVKRSADPAAEAREMRLDRRIGQGAIRGLDLHWDADRILFSYWLKPHSPRAQPYGYQIGNAHIYQMGLESGAVTQLTRSPGDNDIEPIFVPDGTIIFASDRSSYGNQCAGPFIQDKRCTTLYRLDPDRAADPVAISNNKDFDRHPSVLNDGSIAFMHWEYQERGLYHSHNAWRCRPDGTAMDAFYKQHISDLLSIRDVQQAPGSDACIATIQGHHDAHYGPIVRFNPSLGVNNTDSLRMITLGTSSWERSQQADFVFNQPVEQGGVHNRGGYYITPQPLSEKAFLTSHDFADTKVEFNLYYVDVWGNKELVHRDPRMSVFEAEALRQRETPPVLVDTVDPQAKYATAFLANVYRDLPGVEEGEVKYLRMSQALPLPAPVDYRDPGYDFNHLHYLPGDSTAQHFGHWVWSPRRTIGTVKVEQDGSAYFKVPAGTPVYLQALDEDYMEVRRMRASFTLQRGEFRSCIGCHETRPEAVDTRPVYPQKMLAAGPQTPKPPPWGINTVIDYEEHIQPILDQHCVGCHGQRDPAGGLEFSSRKVGGFMQSYRTMHGLESSDPTPIRDMKVHESLHPEARRDAYIRERNEVKRILLRMQANDQPGMLVNISDRTESEADVSQPRQFGSSQSRLIRVLLDDPTHREEVKARMSEEQWRLLVAWVDYNAYYHGTVLDKTFYARRQKNKGIPRVPIYLPSPWVPADLNPTFLNRKNSSIAPPPTDTALPEQ
ncbi:MAG: hypothetical protein ACLFVN_04880 [Phycisphaeraceae bacterium]